MRVRGKALRETLRRATRTLHDAVDEAFGAYDWTRPAGYQKFVAVQLTVLPQLETRLDNAGFERQLHDWPDRKRSSALRRDAALLGVPTTDAPNLDARSLSAAEAVGTAYVLEGSRLGGAALRTRLLRACPELETATAFLAHGRDALFWPNFVNWLDTRRLTEAEQSAAILAAQRTFGAYLTAAQASP